MPASSRKLMSNPWFVRDNARQFLGRRRNAEQKRFQLVQTVVAVGKASRSYTLASLILHLHVMVG
jgi:predicted GTPase